MHPMCSGKALSSLIKYNKVKSVESFQCDVHHEGRRRNFLVLAKKDRQQWRCISIHSSTVLNRERSNPRPCCFFTRIQWTVNSGHKRRAVCSLEKRELSSAKNRTVISQLFTPSPGHNADYTVSVAVHTCYGMCWSFDVITVKLDFGTVHF
jgi:hypothetical protein